jgi:methylated-DNA-[protein]-cysteine S-methyltransferase
MKDLSTTHMITSPIGTLIAKCEGDAITQLDFTDEPYHTNSSVHPLLLQLEKELSDYFEGKRTSFTLPLNPEGTPFQKSVWNTLLSIPYSQTISYAREAKMLGNPKATRAVANSNGKNPIAILIPCHRVIASNGTLGGYSGGIEKKEFLLALEKNLL